MVTEEKKKKYQKINNVNNEINYCYFVSVCSFFSENYVYFVICILCCCLWEDFRKRIILPDTWVQSI